MKGLEPLQWAFVTITLTLVIVVFAVNPLQAAIDQAISQNAELTAQEIRTAINLIQTMPSTAEHELNLKPRTCKIKIDKKSVNVEIKNINATLSIIQTENEIMPAKIDCSLQESITIKKTDGKVEIT